MSEEKFDIAGLNLKEWSFIILMVCLIIVVVSFAVAFIIAISNSPEITISGTIDLGQITGIIFGIALVATVLVAQKLTSNSITTAVAETDKVWLAEKP